MEELINMVTKKPYRIPSIIGTILLTLYLVGLGKGLIFLVIGCIISTIYLMINDRPNTLDKILAFQLAIVVYVIYLLITTMVQSM